MQFTYNMRIYVRVIYLTCQGRDLKGQFLAVYIKRFKTILSVEEMLKACHDQAFTELL